MAFRTNAEPDASQGFLRRICNALDYTPSEIAKITGVPLRELREMLDVPVALVADINKDSVWWTISALVDKRLADHMAVRHELSVALTKQREQQAARLAALHGRSQPPPVRRRPPLQSGR